MFGVAKNDISFMEVRMPSEKRNDTLLIESLDLSLYEEEDLKGRGSSLFQSLCVLRSNYQWFQRKIKIAYVLDKNKPVNIIKHLHFMNKLKLFARVWQVKPFVKTVKVYCKEFGMEFRISKCSGMTMTLAKRETSTAIELLTGETIDNLEETG